MTIKTSHWRLRLELYCLFVFFSLKMDNGLVDCDQSIDVAKPSRGCLCSRRFCSSCCCYCYVLVSLNLIRREWRTRRGWSRSCRSSHTSAISVTRCASLHLTSQWAPASSSSSASAQAQAQAHKGSVGSVRLDSECRECREYEDGERGTGGAFWLIIQHIDRTKRERNTSMMVKMLVVPSASIFSSLVSSDRSIVRPSIL